MDRKYRVSLIPINDLQPHEETCRERVVSIARDIVKLGRILKPVIVEEKTLTIIDGHHRVEALRLLGARYVPAVLANYYKNIEGINAPERKIYVRAQSTEDALNRAADILETLTSKGFGKAKLVISNKSLTITADLTYLYKAIGMLEGMILGRSEKIYELVIKAEALTPELVIKGALKSELYPFKSSLHITRLKKLYYPFKLSALL